MESSNVNESKSDIAPFVKQASKQLITLYINGKQCTLNAFFNLNTEKMYFSFYEESKDYKLSFARIAYYLFSETLQNSKNGESTNFTEADFIEATDEELERIILAILGEGSSIKNEYDRLEGDAFENFYNARKNLLYASIAQIKEVFDAIDNSRNLSTHTILSNMNRMVMDFGRIITPFAEQMRGQVQAIADAFSQALSKIDSSTLTYHREWTDKHDSLVSFGWFYLNELPNEIIDKIFEKPKDIGQSDVDSIIASYFRKDQCASLKYIVRGWNKSRYFAPRKDVFNQALHCHSRGIYNASVTLLALHTEGVITDFVRLAFNTPRFKAEAALNDINEFINDMPISALTFSDWKIFFSVIDAVQVALSESFDLANPENASNNSRHKIAHGHAVDKETEVNSLRRFLYLNELFRIFSSIDDKLGQIADEVSQTENMQE